MRNAGQLPFRDRVRPCARAEVERVEEVRLAKLHQAKGYQEAVEAVVRVGPVGAG